MSERPEPTLEQIALQWLCLWQMSWHLLAFTPAAIAREISAPGRHAQPKRSPNP